MTDLALHATKVTAQDIARSMASLVVLGHHLWLNLTEIKEVDKTLFLDSLVSTFGLFGPAINGFTEAVQHFLPKRSSSAAASSHPRPAPTQQPAKPVPSTAQPTPQPEP